MAVENQPRMRCSSAEPWLSGRLNSILFGPPKVFFPSRRFLSPHRAHPSVACSLPRSPAGACLSVGSPSSEWTRSSPPCARAPSLARSGPFLFPMCGAAESRRRWQNQRKDVISGPPLSPSSCLFTSRILVLCLALDNSRFSHLRRNFTYRDSPHLYFGLGTWPP
jgi:hypothetical protein